MDRPSELELNDARQNNPLLLMATNMADMIQRWGGKPVDIDKDGLRLIAEYLQAIGMELEFSVRPRASKPPENFGE